MREAEAEAEAAEEEMAVVVNGWLELESFLGAAVGEAEAVPERLEEEDGEVPVPVPVGELLAGPVGLGVLVMVWLLLLPSELVSDVREVESTRTLLLATLAALALREGWGIEA